MSRPSSSIEPLRQNPRTLSFMRLRVRRNVDFPHPVGPMSAVTSPGREVEAHVTSEPSSLRIRARRRVAVRTGRGKGRRRGSSTLTRTWAWSRTDSASARVLTVPLVVETLVPSTRTVHSHKVNDRENCGLSDGDRWVNSLDRSGGRRRDSLSGPIRSCVG